MTLTIFKIGLLQTQISTLSLPPLPGQLLLSGNASPHHRAAAQRVCLLNKPVCRQEHHTPCFPFALDWMWNVAPGLQLGAVLGKAVEPLGAKPYRREVGHWGNCWSLRSLPHFLSTLLLSDHVASCPPLPTKRSLAEWMASSWIVDPNDSRSLLLAGYFVTTRKAT